MNMQATMLEMSTISTTPSQHLHKPNTNHRDSFSSVLSRTQAKNERQENNIITNEKESVTAKSSMVEDPTNVTKNDLPKSESAQVDNKPKETDLAKQVEAEKMIIKAIADILQITPDQLDEILATLQIGIYDLLQVDNLQQLLMVVHDVDEPMDLLLIPEITSELKAVTAILEGYSADSLTGIPRETRSKQEVAISTDENILSTNGNSNKDSQKDTKMNMGNKAMVPDDNTQVLDTNKTDLGKVDALVKNNETTWQNEEQPTSSQNSSANQFLETLAQSIGDAFQMQNEQVEQVNQAVTGRHEVIEPQMLLDQIVERIKVSIIEEDAQMNIQLKPEHLGKLSMEVISKQGTMTAHFTVENERVKEAIEQNIQSLKESLESKGLVIEELEVTVGQNQQENEQANTNPRPNRNISQIIDRIMNEDMIEEDAAALDHRYEGETNEVDFIA